MMKQYMCFISSVFWFLEKFKLTLYPHGRDTGKETKRETFLTPSTHRDL